MEMPTNKDWAAVVDYLLKEVVGRMGDKRARGEAWVAALDRCADGRRLGVCIAIDVCSGAIPPDRFADIIKDIDPDRPDAREEFGRIVNTPPHWEALICASNHYHFEDSMDAGDVYVRVMELGQFSAYLADTADQGYTRAARHVNRVRRKYFGRGGGVSLSGVRRWLRGRMPNVWVTSFAALKALVEGEDAGRRGTVAYDALGLSFENGVGGENRPELVGVVYPKQFSIGCPQPSTFDAYWIEAGWRFVSYVKENSWGRTLSLSGKHQPQPERVHTYFKNLVEGYATYYIGVAERPEEQNEEFFLERGYERFRRALAAQTRQSP